MTCEGCVAKVRYKLLQNPDVTAADVSLHDLKAVVTMSRHLSVNELQDSIGRDTKYKITEDRHDQKGSGSWVQGSGFEVKGSAESKSWITTYYPLLLIFAFISGVSLVASWNQGAVNAMQFMNAFMAGFFIVFSFFKLLDLKGFAESYAMYDLLAIKVPAYGYVYPFIELGLGVAFLTHTQPFYINIATIAVMGFSSIGVIRSVIDKKQIRCACLGSVFNLPMSTVTIVEDLLMVAMAGLMIALS
jgi:cation transport ATPase